jgi:lipoprotein signal peptidase
LMLANPPGTTSRTAAAYSLVGVALLASWVMQQNNGLAWGRLEVTMAAVAVAALALSVFLAVCPVAHGWSARGPYTSGPRG